MLQWNESQKDRALVYGALVIILLFWKNSFWEDFEHENTLTSSKVSWLKEKAVKYWVYKGMDAANVIFFTS